MFDSALLQTVFGDRLHQDVPLARHTTARVGGPADYLVEVHSANELADTTAWLWQQDLPFTILGGGTNVLVSDAGIRGIILLNKARKYQFSEHPFSQDPLPGLPFCTVWAESGANLGALARQAARRGLGGLEWAAGIPGTLGGAIVGNAGAHGGDTAGNLLVAEILHRSRQERYTTGVSYDIHREEWKTDQFHFAYRTSILKHYPEPDTLSELGATGQSRFQTNQEQQRWAVVLSARLRLTPSNPQEVQARMDEFVAYRRRTQPPGAGMGSMFKNPPGDYAGRLIEAVGLKGTQLGGAEISPLHANFFINRGKARAAEIRALIEIARQKVADRFGINLELEVELLGEWN